MTTRFSVLDRWERLPEALRHRDVTAVDVDTADHVYLLTRYPGQVLVFDPDGNLIRAWGEGVFTTPHGLTVGPDGRIWCVDAGDHTVRAFTPEGVLLTTLGIPGEPSDTGYAGVPVRIHTVERVRYPGPPFNRCTNLAVGPDGDLYVADGYGNCRVHRFDPAGRLRSSWGEVGTGPGQFHLPHGIAVTPDGRVLVADRENDRIQVFDLDGGYLDAWTGVRRPCDLAVARDGSVYVAELNRPAGTRSFVAGPVEHDLPGRVSVLDGGGAVLDRWEGVDFVAPHGIAVDSRGDVYVAEVTYSFGIRPGRVSADRADEQLRKFVRVDEDIPASMGSGHEA